MKRVKLVIREVIWFCFPTRTAFVVFLCAFTVLEMNIWLHRRAYRAMQTEGYAAGRTVYEGTPREAATLPAGHYRIESVDGSLAVISQLGPHGNFPIVAQDLPTEFRAGDRFTRFGTRFHRS